MSIRCTRAGLASQYAVIGASLLAVERADAPSPLRLMRKLQRTDGDGSSSAGISADVAFISVEVLESYLDDLLDIEITDDVLYIRRPQHESKTAILALIGLAASFCVGLLAARAQASLPVVFGITLCSALPFALLWQQAPTIGLARRMNFAQILAHEIARRRGRDDGDSLAGIAAIIGQPRLGWRGSSAQSAARSLMH